MYHGPLLLRICGVRKFTAVIMYILMKLPLLSIILAAISGATSALSPLSPLCPPHPTSPEMQRTIFSDFIHTWMVDKNYEGAWRRHVDRNYIQHNPWVLSGRDNVITALSAIVPFSNFTLLHSGFDDDKDWAHYRWDAPNTTMPNAVMDLFRFNGTCIVEH